MYKIKNKHMEKTYSIINISDLTNIDFSQIHETNQNTIRKSIDESQFVIKYTTKPSFIVDGTVSPVQTLNHENCLILMATDEWSINEPNEE